MSLTDRVMENTLAYRLLQAPFAEEKLAPVLAHNDLAEARRVLDAGCGPGTNTRRFARAYYLGVDINLKYLRHARRRYERDFVAADLRNGAPVGDGQFDFILVNSFLHHLATPEARWILGQLRELLTHEGHVHLLELVRPERVSLAWLLSRLDRGNFPRPIGEWETLFGEYFDLVVFEPYTLKGLGRPLWHMVYCKGRAKR